MATFTRFLLVVLGCFAAVGCDAPATRQPDGSGTSDDAAADTAHLLAEAPEPCTTCRTEEAYPGQPGTPRTVTINGQQVTVVVVKGRAVWQGDIILPLAVLDDSNKKSKSGARVIGQAWPGKAVFYRIHPALANKQRVRDAIAHWEAKTSIRFWPYRNASETPNFVTFSTGEGCGSLVGMQGGEQVVELEPGCSRGNVIHEIGHVVGLLHEIMRNDRDDHVRINTGNILDGKGHNFSKYRAAGFDGHDEGEFDFNSRMLYESYAFSKQDKELPTITRRDGSVYPTNYTVLSTGDVKAVEAKYLAQDE